MKPDPTNQNPSDDYFPPDRPFLIAGPCSLESLELSLAVGRHMTVLCERLGYRYIFKGSFDKANRSSATTPRGPGLEKGLEILSAVRAELGVPVLSDVHTPDMVGKTAEVLDIVQIPAFLARQTDFYLEAARFGKAVHVKKGQFMAPEEMGHAVQKFRSAGGGAIALCERGTTFGYGNLVVDFRSIQIMKSFGVPYVFDATHSVQRPAARGDASGGDRRFLPLLARAQMAAGADGLFMEVHPDPAKALSDKETQWPLDRAEELLAELKRAWELARDWKPFEVS